MPKIYVACDWIEREQAFITSKTKYSYGHEIEVDQEWLDGYNKAMTEYNKFRYELDDKFHAAEKGIRERNDHIKSIKSAKSRSDKHEILLKHGWVKEDVSRYSKNGETLMMHEAFMEVKRLYIGVNAE